MKTFEIKLLDLMEKSALLRKQLSHILFDVDPMNISYSDSEYDNIAGYAIEICLSSKLNIIESINESLRVHFFEDSILTTEQEKQINEQLRKI